MQQEYVPPSEQELRDAIQSSNSVIYKCGRCGKFFNLLQVSTIEDFCTISPIICPLNKNFIR
jgi:DNA-directed RNA polymerase subunit RPC12/RpoP